MVSAQATNKHCATNGNSCETQTVWSYAPMVDIVENPEEVLLIADVPGATMDNIDIQLDRGTLTINASVSPRQDQSSTSYLLREYGVGNYQRSFEVGEQIQADKISAQVSNGVLTVHLSKAEALKPRKIQVNNA